jgi:hypothetical protein
MTRNTSNTMNTTVRGRHSGQAVFAASSLLGALAGALVGSRDTTVQLPHRGQRRESSSLSGRGALQVLHFSVDKEAPQ